MTDLLPTLSSLILNDDNPAVEHASFLALDRLVITDTTTILEALEADPDLLRGRETARADFFARANLNDPQQMQIVENYLLNPQISAAEIDAFAGIFPNANFMISQNLLTEPPKLDGPAIAARDAASLRVVKEWLSDPRFSNVKAALTKISLRLQGFVRQESEN